jgi:hypothetical protein
MIRASAYISAARANLSGLVAGVKSQIFKDKTDFRNCGDVITCICNVCPLFGVWDRQHPGRSLARPVQDNSTDPSCARAPRGAAPAHAQARPLGSGQCHPEIVSCVTGLGRSQEVVHEIDIAQQVIILCIFVHNLFYLVLLTSLFYKIACVSNLLCVRGHAPLFTYNAMRIESV